MQSYYVQGLDEKENYQMFVRYMSAYSNAFSLVYFRYTENERVKKSVRAIKKKLAPYKISTERKTVLPSMVTLNEFHHIYELAIYRTNFDTLDVLESAESIFDWDYPSRPMDLSFFQNGYAWFASSAHEQWNALYTEDKHILQDLQDLGIQAIAKEDVALSSLYFDRNAEL